MEKLKQAISTVVKPLQVRRAVSRAAQERAEDIIAEFLRHVRPESGGIVSAREVHALLALGDEHVLRGALEAVGKRVSEATGAVGDHVRLGLIAVRLAARRLARLELMERYLQTAAGISGLETVKAGERLLNTVMRRLKVSSPAELLARMRFDEEFRKEVEEIADSLLRSPEYLKLRRVGAKPAELVSALARAHLAARGRLGRLASAAKPAAQKMALAGGASVAAMTYAAMIAALSGLSQTVPGMGPLARATLEAASIVGGRLDRRLFKHAFEKKSIIPVHHEQDVIR